MQTSSAKIKLGFIGAGFIGQVAHIENYAQLDDCELYGIADLRPELLTQVASKFGFNKTYADHHALLQDDNIDAVIVVTARAHTVQVVKDCLLAGKHVFSEKPMAGNSKDANALVELAKARQLVYCVGYMKRFDAGVIKAKALFSQLIDSKELGELLQVNAHCYMGDSYCKAGGYIHSQQARPQMPDEADFAPEWLNSEHRPLFARYVNVHSHLLNLLRYFLNCDMDVEYFNFLSAKAHVCVMRTDRQLVTLHTGEVDQKDWQEQCTFVFEHGQLQVSLPPALLRNVPAQVELQRNGEIAEKTQYQAPWSWAFKTQAQAFLEALRQQNLSSPIAASEALSDIQLAEEIWQKISN
ncbi:Gfo/Idh/MocA family protein [Pseudoalteromonas rubra]|uniref:Gfo/Idh/MocA family protein n=1 Tax=Pseudoalteromonas rubra TaxID=43658 RepID=UPI000F7B5772|nr:Gfo/Idh/MocA family oxidoreductase [Pseudoalteromonas rubra]